MRQLVYPLLPIFFWLTACVTSETQPQARPASKKTYESCICGPLRNGAGALQCAIWPRAQRVDIPQTAYTGVASATCEPADCSRLFSPFCQKIEMSPTRTAPLPPEVKASSCYCDTVLVENERGQVRNLCAAWSDDAPHLIEYYPLESCPPQRCGEAPFHIARTLCKGNFKPFYVPTTQR